MDKAPPESTAPTQNKRQPSGAVVRVSRIASLSAQWRDERFLYVVINLADGMYAVMAIPTVVGSILLSPKVMKEAKRYFSSLD